MSFASLTFAIFMAIVYPLYLVLPHRWQNALLLVASYVFYGWWDWRFLGLLIFTTLWDYGVGQMLGRLEDPGKRKLVLTSSILVNLGVLGFFKYFNFFAHSFEALLGQIGLHPDWVTLHIVLPIGISFYTFQSMSYTIDVYRRKMKPAPLFTFATFVAFFPQLVAGPIERAVDLIPRIEKPRVVTWDLFTRGLFLILWGLFKKIAISDGVARCVNALYDSTGAVHGWDVVLATWLFAIQIYCDFSGYSDIARGLAKTMGFDLMVNFRLPYFALHPSDFWQRWHISLSSWLRDYLYIPLGGSRGGEKKTYRNLMTTMLLGGLWHGAAWNFVLWGAYQGVILCIHRVWSGVRGAGAKLNGALAGFGRAVNILLFLQVTCYGWLLFRAGSFDQIARFTRALFTGWHAAGSVVPNPPLPTILGLGLLLLFDFSHYLTNDAQFYRRWPSPVRGAFYASTAFVLLLGLSNESTQFIYFQF